MWRECVLLLLLTVLFVSGLSPNFKEPSAAKPLDISNWKRVLFISAHPDDIEGTVGGTVYNLIKQKSEVFYVILTNGDKGCGADFCKNWTSEHIAYVRYEEQMNASTALGVPLSNVVMLDYEDAMLTSYPEQDPRQQLIHQIRTIKPDVVLAWHPYPDFTLLPSEGWGDLGFHPDHQDSGRLALAAKFDAGVPLLFPSAGASWDAKEFYFWGFSNPTHYLPIDETALQARVNAFLEHKTQYPDPAMVKHLITFVAQQSAIATGVSNVTYSEDFIAYF
eukprot:TRINITY_DN3704_c0_g1_i2.p1 TRINITY_DN3704_c0_g1~~TRINITY_DN3704_c0_g1_i2.p1  ORF type:complete len:277 (+),score=61.02 TRINITY_DN3704_c0_g1_i2:758-1588(+)